MRKTLFITALTGSIALVACQAVHTTQGGVVGVTRSQQMMVSAQEIDKASAQEYSEMLTQARSKSMLNRDAAMLSRVRAISNRIIAQVGVYRTDAVRWPWEVNVFNSDEINAFCMAGGKIGVYSGIISKLSLTDDELAAVIGHEVSHALREHVREQVSRQAAGSMGLQLGVAVLGAVTGNAQLAQAGKELGPLLVQTMFTLPRSREAEVEADRMGLELAARAGYNPRAAVTLWQKMSQQGGARGPEFLSTHPSAQTRIQELEATAKTVEPLYRAAKRP